MWWFWESVGINLQAEQQRRVGVKRAILPAATQDRTASLAQDASLGRLSRMLSRGSSMGHPDLIGAE